MASFGGLVDANVVVIGKEIVDFKLLMAAPRILAHNRLMVGTMLGEIKGELVAETPLGPGHFGYHLRDRYSTDVKSTGVRTTGVVKAPPQGYWREYGTLGHFRNRKNPLRSYASAIGGFGAGGEAAGRFAHKAYAHVRHVIKAFYGGMALWYRL